MTPQNIKSQNIPNLNTNISNNYFLNTLSIILGASIATSTSIMSISYTLVVILILFKLFIKKFHLNANHKLEFISLIKSQKFVMSSLLFYLIFVIFSIFNYQNPNDVYHMLSKIIAYLLSPIFFIYFTQEKNRFYFLLGFIIGVILATLASYIAYIFNLHILMGAKDSAWVVFHDHILHNTFLAIASAILLLIAFDKKTSLNLKYSCIILHIILAINILFIVNGRTGQIIYLIITAFIIVRKFHLKGLIYLLISSMIIAPILYHSTVIQQGIANYKRDIALYNNGEYHTSMAARKIFHKVSNQLIKEHPLLGYGTGSFARVYANYANKHKLQPLTNNPHRDILWIAVETGIFGCIIFMLMLFSLILQLFKLDSFHKNLGFVLLITYILASLENSFFIDNVTSISFMLLTCSIIRNLE